MKEDRERMKIGDSITTTTLRQTESLSDEPRKKLIENLQRDDLTSIERENALDALWSSKRYKTYDPCNKPFPGSPHIRCTKRKGHITMFGGMCGCGGPDNNEVMWDSE